MGSSGFSLPLLWYDTVMYSLNVRAISESPWYFILCSKGSDISCSMSQLG